jgi:broad specificity phosphatase PhoE
MHDNLALASEDRSWSLLIRHAARPKIPTGTFGNGLSITEEGRREATTLGRQLGNRIHRIVTSPVLRCVQTAEAVQLGAGTSASADTDQVLGDPGVWITDSGVVGDAFFQHGPRGVVARQLAGDEIPGMTPIDVGAKRFVDALVSNPGEPGEINVFVSHDAVIAPLLAAILGVHDLTKIWPAYLEGAFLSSVVDSIDIVWRGHRQRLQWIST